MKIISMWFWLLLTQMLDNNDIMSVNASEAVEGNPLEEKNYRILLRDSFCDKRLFVKS